MRVAGDAWPEHMRCRESSGVWGCWEGLLGGTPELKLGGQSGRIGGGCVVERLEGGPVEAGLDHTGLVDRGVRGLDLIRRQCLPGKDF